MGVKSVDNLLAAHCPTLSTSSLSDYKDHGGVMSAW